MLSVNHLQQEYDKYCSNVQKAFDQYQKYGKLSKLPDLEIEWKKYSSLFDFDSFIKPVIDELKKLVGYAPNLNSHHEDCLPFSSGQIAIILNRFLGHLNNLNEQFQFKSLEIILHWLKFHTARLKGLYISKTDIEALNDWLRICYDLENRKSAYYFTLYQFNRDQEMRYLVFDEKGQVLEFFNNKMAPGPHYIPKLINWFLQRYDLAAACELLKLKASGQVKPNKTIQAGLGQRYPEGFWLFNGISVTIISFFLTLASGYISDYQFPWTITSLFPLPGARLFYDSSLQLWFAPLYQVGAFLFFLIVIILFPTDQLHAARDRGQYTLDFHFDLSQRFLPRLFAGILVGYIPLVTAGDPWKWLLRMPAFPEGIICFIAMLSVALGYLFFEARKTLASGQYDKCMRQELRKRVLYVFSVGFLQALLVGLFICELFSVAIFPTLLDSMKDTTVIGIAGFIGFIFPKLILLYAPFSLLLGIIIQLIWQDQTVTQPL